MRKVYSQFMFKLNTNVVGGALTLWSRTWWLCYTSNCLYWVFDIALKAAVRRVQPDFPVPPLDPGRWGRGWGAGHGTLGPCTPLTPDAVLWFGTTWKIEKKSLNNKRKNLFIDSQTVTNQNTWLSINRYNMLQPILGLEKGKKFGQI